MNTRTRTLTTALMMMIAATAVLAAQARPPARKPATPAAAAAKPAAEQAVPFAAGETLTYNVGWSTYFTAGTATMRVQERRPMGANRAAFVLVAEGKPASVLSALYDLYYKAETQLDTRSLLPLTASVFSKEGSRTRVKTTHFKGAGRTADYELRTSTVSKRQLTVAPYTQDALSAIYVLRKVLYLKPGEFLKMPVTTGGDVYNADIRVGSAPETVKTSAGTFQAWKVSINAIDQATRQPAARGMHVWFSNDARRLPVKMEAGLAVGAFTLTLAGVR